MKKSVSYGSLVRWTSIVIVASLVVNTLLTYMGRIVSHPPLTFGPYEYMSVISLTVVGVIAAAIVYALMRIWIADTTRANSAYLLLSLVVLVGSFYPDVMLPYSPDPDQVGWTYGIMANLMLMHVVPAVLVMWAFTKKVRDN